VQLLIEDCRPAFQQKVSTPQRPLHLLLVELVDESSADALG